MSGPPKPWEMDAAARRRRVRALLFQAALWAPTTGEKDAILEALQEQQDWEDSLPTRWSGDADVQLCPTQPVVRPSAPVVQVKSPPPLGSGNLE